MSLPFPLKITSDRPAPDWSAQIDLGDAASHYGFRRPENVQENAQYSLRVYMIKHFWRARLGELSRRDISAIEKSWSGSAAVRKLDNILGGQLYFRGYTDIQSEEPRPVPRYLVFEDPVAEVPYRRTVTNFTPSRTLVGFWERGLRSHIAEFTRKSFIQAIISIFGRQTYRSTADAFAKKFFSMLSVLANRQKHELFSYQTFSENSRFSVAVQHQLLDRFPIIPDEATNFFKIFHDELVEHLRSGGTIEGRWGKLVLKGDSLILRNNKRDIAKKKKNGRSPELLSDNKAGQLWNGSASCIFQICTFALRQIVRIGDGSFAKYQQFPLSTFRLQH